MGCICKHCGNEYSDSYYVYWYDIAIINNSDNPDRVFMTNIYTIRCDNGSYDIDSVLYNFANECKCDINDITLLSQYLDINNNEILETYFEDFSEDDRNYINDILDSNGLTSLSDLGPYCIECETKLM